MPDHRHVVLGVIASAHGVRGQVKIKPYTAEPDGLIAYGPLSDASGRDYHLTITGESKGQLICSIDGITNRTDAETLRGTKLMVARSALPDTDADEYYLEDLVGLQVQCEDGASYGVIKAVHNFGAGDIVDIMRASDNHIESVPFTNDHFPDICIDEGHIVYVAPEFIQADER